MGLLASDGGARLDVPGYCVSHYLIIRVRPCSHDTSFPLLLSRHFQLGLYQVPLIYSPFFFSINFGSVIPHVGHILSSPN